MQRNSHQFGSNFRGIRLIKANILYKLTVIPNKYNVEPENLSFDAPISQFTLKAFLLVMVGLMT